MKYRIIFILTFIFALSVHLNAQTIDKEKDVPSYTLPELLTSGNGQQIKTTEEWETIRRPELLELFQNDMYGKIPENKDVKIEYITKSADMQALGGKATRREIIIHITSGAKTLDVPVLIYLPNREQKPVPVFIGLNFSGNHTICPDTAITIFSIPDAKMAPRGSASQQWQLEKILDNGYGLITACYNSFESDNKNGDKRGIRSLFHQTDERPDSAEWGAIAAWAWGLSRMLDYAEKDNRIDAKRAIVIGHSRLGKTALCAGVSDPRFAIVISNDSGCGGAALFRRKFGETVAVVNKNFPHWFCGNFKKYSNNEEALPFDQHELLALIAPRPLYVASASEDLWSDPQGEFLSAFYATPVYNLYGKKGITTKRRPPVNKPIIKTIGYHIRSGKHDITSFDWDQYIKFANLYLKD